MINGVLPTALGIYRDVNKDSWIILQLAIVGELLVDLSAICLLFVAERFTSCAGTVMLQLCLALTQFVARSDSHASRVL
jgi:hypothetical protein